MQCKGESPAFRTSLGYGPRIRRRLKRHSRWERLTYARKVRYETIDLGLGRGPDALDEDYTVYPAAQLQATEGVEGLGTYENARKS